MIVAVNKPIGWTSFAVVKKIRRITGEKKVGHAGTLDPFAEGVLVVGVGRESTRKLAFLMNQQKEYEAVLKLGTETDTLDCEGDVVARAAVPPLTEEHIKSVFRQFTGRIEQVPPMFSAKKVNGMRLYKLARKQIEVERKPAQIEIESLVLKSFTQNTISFTVNCSKGTYIRQLGKDISLALSTVGHLSSLRRIRVGDYTIGRCITLEDLEQRWLSIAV